MESARHILCVEPDDDFREMLAIHLESEGFLVSSIKRPAEALAKTEEKSFQLVLLECTSPNEGLELCRKLRERGMKMPIVFLSSWAYPLLCPEKALAAGASLYLMKPNDLPFLGRRLREVLTIFGRGH